MSRLAALLGLSLVVLTAVCSEELEIVVTASRVEEDARSTPAYVRVIPEEVIERGDTVLDALRSLPDVAIRETSPGKESVSMGGFGENGFARTLILIDGRPVNRADMASFNWRTIPLDRVERIEVVKGPMSSQYGDQAVAGVINIITKDPDGLEIWLRANLTTNLTNRQGAGAAWGVEKFRVEGGFRREDLRPVRDRSDSELISTNLRLGGTAGVVDIDVAGSFSDAEYQLPGGLSKAQFDQDPNQSLYQNDEVGERRYGANLDLNAELGAVNIGLPLSWSRLDSTVNIDSWFSWNDTRLDDIRGSLQADMNWFLGDKVALVPVVGIDTNWSQINVKIYSERERITKTDDNTPKRIDLGLWARTKALIGEDWVLDAGLRYSYYDVKMGPDSTQFMPFVYDVGTSWRPDSDWSVSARYGRVFRYPTLDEQASYNGFPGSPFNPDLKPEFGHNVTTSVEYAKNGFSASLAPYFIAMNNEIAYVFPVGNVNIGNTYHFGGVVSGSWQSRIVGLEASYSYDNAQFTDDGKTVPLVPAHTVYGRISVRPIESVELSTDGRFSSSYFEGGDFDNLLAMIPGRVSWNARIDWRPVKDLTLYAQILNILDNRTPQYVYYSEWYPTEGRVIDFGVTWQF